ncbi:aminotransferase class I/II-fold pyridoxal phosphate-dependent enzyme [Phenylobacterium sp.]|uniref:aminotransferase class I/II-fold pyridoxal phosphate-dependent enzyme n=1 Tax=Phenylobacterium sp. TaxID=1871053 RepID=UPI003BAA04BA
MANIDGFRRHGGRLAAAKAAFPDAPSPWLDLSTGINPDPWRGPRARVSDLRRLPDPYAVAALEAAAAGAFGADPACVAAVAGAEAGLRLLPHLTGAASVAIVSPTYGAHADAWRNAGKKVSGIALAEAGVSHAEALVVVNPNNPDGVRCAPASLVDGRRWLIVDESFAETVPDLSVAGAALQRTIELRSFGKFYGLPGARLGFIVAEPGVAARTRALVGDWPVSADAIALGTAAYADAAWRRAAVSKLTNAAERLDALLIDAGFTSAGGTTLFRLTRSADAARRFAILASHGVLTRPFAHDPTLLRFGLPGRGGWVRLTAALRRL